MYKVSIWVYTAESCSVQCTNIVLSNVTTRALLSACNTMLHCDRTIHYLALSKLFLLPSLGALTSIKSKLLQHKGAIWPALGVYTAPVSPSHLHHSLAPASCTGSATPADSTYTCLMLHLSRCQHGFIQNRPTLGQLGSVQSVLLVVNEERNRSLSRSAILFIPTFAQS